MFVKQIETEHLQDVAVIHLHSFPKSALTQLGNEAVRRYYEWQLTGPHDCLAIGAFNEQGRMLGFSFGGLFQGALSGFVNKNKKYLVFYVLKRPWLILTNSIFRDRIRLGLRVIISKPQQVACDRKTAAKSFGILSIAVDPHAQGYGIGRQLMEYSEAYALEKGFSEMHLSVALDNYKALRFYEHNGWKKEFDKGVWKGRMIKPIHR